MVSFGGPPDLLPQPGLGPPAHPKVKLVPTAEGMQAFEISFPAALPDTLALTLENALDGVPHLPHLLEPTTTRMLALHRHIHRALVLCMPESRPDLLLQMVAESGRLGPRNIVWLRKKLNPKHVGTNVKAVLDIFGGTIDSGIRAQVKAVESIIAKARPLAGDFELNNVLLALVIIFKLPSSSKIRQDLIVKDPLPSPEEILLLLEQLAAFDTDVEPFYSENGAFAGIANDTRKKECYNCGGDHDKHLCVAPKSDCDVCGAGIGHTNKYCLAQTTRSIPASITESVKQKILAKRKAFFAPKEVAAYVLPAPADGLPTLEDEAAFIAELDDEWLIACQAAETAGGVAAVCLACD